MQFVQLYDVLCLDGCLFGGFMSRIGIYLDDENS